MVGLVLVKANSINYFATMECPNSHNMIADTTMHDDNDNFPNNDSDDII